MLSVYLNNTALKKLLGVALSALHEILDLIPSEVPQQLGFEALLLLGKVYEMLKLKINSIRLD
jgi:hypothetical protein